MFDFKPLPVCVVGCGGMGLRHILAIAEMQGSNCAVFDLRAVCDENPIRATEAADLAEQMGLARPAITSSSEALFDDPELEAALIVLPTFLHHKVATRSLEAGKHVLIEKPLALTVAECNRLQETSDRSGKVVSIAENFRRIPSNRAFKTLLDSGSLGSPRAMIVNKIGPAHEIRQVAAKVVHAPSWYQDTRKAGSYHVLELGVHEIDLQQYWFGQIDSVQATQTSASGGAEQATFISLRFQNGMASQISFISSAYQYEKCERLMIGDGGMANSNAWHAWQDGEIALADEAKQSIGQMTEEFMSKLTQHQLLRQFAPGSHSKNARYSNPSEPLSYGVGAAHYDFAYSVRTGAKPEIGIAEGRTILEVCEAILASARDGVEVRLK